MTEHAKLRQGRCRVSGCSLESICYLCSCPKSPDAGRLRLLRPDTSEFRLGWGIARVRHSIRFSGECSEYFQEKVDSSFGGIPRHRLQLPSPGLLQTGNSSAEHQRVVGLQRGRSLLLALAADSNGGNGRRDSGEGCDDANRVAGDGCGQFCQASMGQDGEGRRCRFCRPPPLPCPASCHKLPKVEPGYACIPMAVQGPGLK